VSISVQTVSRRVNTRHALVAATPSTDVAEMGAWLTHPEYFGGHARRVIVSCSRQSQASTDRSISTAWMSCSVSCIRDAATRRNAQSDESQQRNCGFRHTEGAAMPMLAETSLSRHPATRHFFVFRCLSLSIRFEACPGLTVKASAHPTSVIFVFLFFFTWLQ
jgi:hypothetical protein